METRGIGFRTEALLEPQAALARYFAHVQLTSPRVERVRIEQALGRALAADVVSDGPYPRWPRSAMDGFAVRSCDLPGRLAIVGDIRIGVPWSGELREKSAVRIPTGGIVPPGADTVVPIEDARVSGNVVDVPAATRGDAVTPAGSDMRAGETLLRRSHVLRPADLALLASLGRTEVDVYRRPNVAVISSGDELVEPGRDLSAGQIYDSNRYGVAASLERMGCRAQHFAIAPDDARALEGLLRGAIEECDAVILTGGSSVGERDLTPQIVAQIGTPGVVVHGLRVKPGKPTVLGAVGGKPVIGLPGNPVSAQTILAFVARPIFLAIAGRNESRTAVRAVLQTPLQKRKGWTWYVPTLLDEAHEPRKAYPLELRSSSVSLLARAHGVLILGEHIESLDAGADVDIEPL